MNLSKSNASNTTKALHLLLSSNYFEIPLVIVAVGMSLTIILGNVIVITAFIINKKLRHYSNYFLLNLSVADLLIGFLIPSYMILRLQDNKVNDVICKSWLVLDYVTCSASVLCIVAISLDRFLLVYKGLEYIANKKPYKASIIIVIVWGNIS